MCNMLLLETKVDSVTTAGSTTRLRVKVCVSRQSCVLVCRNYFRLYVQQYVVLQHMCATAYLIDFAIRWFITGGRFVVSQCVNVVHMYIHIQSILWSKSLLYCN
jgi:hypothetical protein